MVRHTLKIFQQMLQDFQSVSGHFVALCIKGLTDEFTTFSEKKNPTVLLSAVFKEKESPHNTKFIYYFQYNTCGGLQNLVKESYKNRIIMVLRRV